MTAQLSKDGALLTVHVPMAFRKRGGRKLMLAPSGTQISRLPGTRVDSALVKAIVRAHRWRRMLESGAYASITELAEAEKINQSYLCRILRLNLLAPGGYSAFDASHRMKGWAAKEASQNIGVSSTSRVAIRGKRRATGVAANSAGA